MFRAPLRSAAVSELRFAPPPTALSHRTCANTPRRLRSAQHIPPPRRAMAVVVATQKRQDDAMPFPPLAGRGFLPRRQLCHRCACGGRVCWGAPMMEPRMLHDDWGSVVGAVFIEELARLRGWSASTASRMGGRSEVSIPLPRGDTSHLLEAGGERHELRG
jgi:hypothetical protein